MDETLKQILAELQSMKNGQEELASKVSNLSVQMSSGFNTIESKIQWG